MPPQLSRPLVRPLVARRLTPPKDPKTGAPFAGKPVETENGLIWTTSERTWSPKGLVSFTIPGGQAVWANLSRRWWSYGTDGGAGLLDAVTGTMRVLPNVQGPVNDSGIDEHGVPVGVRNWPDTVYGRPSHGETPLKLPPGYVDSPHMYSTVIAAPKGTTMAGALTLGSDEPPDILPFVWPNAAAEPRPLPMPAGYSHCIVSALNSRGDVAGLVTASALPNRVLIWRADGSTVPVPVGSRHSDDWIRDANNPTRWSPSEPMFLTDDGILIGRELAKDAIWGHITTYWDGRRTLWLPDAIEGVRARDFETIRLASDGRSLLTRIWDGQVWGWYRVSPR